MGMVLIRYLVILFDYFKYILSVIRNKILKRRKKKNFLIWKRKVKLKFIDIKV